MWRCDRLPQAQRQGLQAGDQCGYGAGKTPPAKGWPPAAASAVATITRRPDADNRRCVAPTRRGPGLLPHTGPRSSTGATLRVQSGDDRKSPNCCARCAGLRKASEAEAKVPAHAGHGLRQKGLVWRSSGSGVGPTCHPATAVSGGNVDDNGQALRTGRATSRVALAVSYALPRAITVPKARANQLGQCVALFCRKPRLPRNRGRSVSRSPFAVTKTKSRCATRITVRRAPTGSWG